MGLSGVYRMTAGVSSDCRRAPVAVPLSSVRPRCCRSAVGLQMSGDREKRYSQVYFEKDADGRPSEDGVFAVEDAKQVSVMAILHPEVVFALTDVDVDCVLQVALIVVVGR